MENGKQNPVAKLLVSVLSTLAEIDYKNRREAQRKGIERAKAEGKYKGRANSNPALKQSATGQNEYRWIYD